MVEAESDIKQKKTEKNIETRLERLYKYVITEILPQMAFILIQEFGFWENT